MVRKKTSQKSKKESAYDAKDIYVLEGLEPVRKRPAMYIGSTGPDGLHHLLVEVVANSLTYQTPILFRKAGKISILPIGELVDKFFVKNPHLLEKSLKGETEILRKDFEIEALSFDPQNLKLKFQPISSLIRHKVNSEIYQVTLQNNRKIEITPYHSLFTLKEGRVLPIEGREIKIGTPIVVPQIWPEPECPPKEIDLIDELLKLPKAKTAKINLYGLTPLLKSNKILAQKIWQNIPKSKKSRYGNLRKRKSFYYDYLRWNYLPFNIIRNLSKEDIREIKNTSCFLGNKRTDGWKLPIKLPITRELIQLLGIFAAEGTIEEDERGYYRFAFSFGSSEKELIEFCRQLIKKVFKLKPALRYAHESARVLVFTSLLIGIIFKNIFQTGENSTNKKIPDLIFNLDKELRAVYLIAYLAGDGCPTEFWTRHLIKDTLPLAKERRKFSFAAKNSYLVSNFSYLLSSLNKTYSCGKRRRKNEKKFIKVTYKGKEKKREFKPKKFSYAIDFYWNTNSFYINYLPSREVINKVFWGWPHEFSLNFYGKNGGVSRNKVLTLLEREKLVLYPGSLEFINSDLGILRVRKIEKIKYSYPYVYDLSVPNGENFVGGFSPICCHNSVDEAVMGHCTEIKTYLLPQNRIKVEDNGRGIPVAKHPRTKKSALETVMTYLHAGAKFGGKIYISTGGLHGVGVSAVCALSDFMRVEVSRDGQKYFQEYSRGKPKAKVKKLGKCKGTGTTVIFEPDSQVFPEIKWDLKRILNHLRQQAYLTKGLKISLIDQRQKPLNSYTFYFEGGLPSYIKHLIRGQTPRHQNIFYGIGEKNGTIVEAVFQYTDEYECYEECFANNVWTRDGGTHLTGFRTALTRTFNDHARKNGFLKESDENLTGEDIREGLTSVVSIKIKDPQFEGQVKAKLGNSEAKVVTEAVVSETLTDFLERNPQDARLILEKCVLSQRARKAAKTARETVLKRGVLEGLALPGKLADCASRKPEESELFIVEGESAGGSGKQGRDRRFQAILPLRGKILNVERARLDKILSSKEIRALIIGLGTAIGEDFNLEKIRYHRIILTLDGDVDGSHIRTLLLTLFYRYFKPIIEKGYLYIAQPPLYKIQSGKEIKHAYTEDQKLAVLKSLKKTSGISIQRYKGLGEMNSAELWETTMNPQNRILLQVTIEDAKEADRIFDILMGNEVLPRKKFIQAHAKKVRNLDI